MGTCERDLFKDANLSLSLSHSLSPLSNLSQFDVAFLNVSWDQFSRVRHSGCSPLEDCSSLSYDFDLVANAIDYIVTFV